MNSRSQDRRLAFCICVGAKQLFDPIGTASIGIRAGLLVLLISLFLAGPLFGQQTNPNIAGKILRVTDHRKVEFRYKGSTNWNFAHPNTLLEHGGAVRTGPQATATIQWSDQTIWEMGADSYLEIPERQTGLTARISRGLYFIFHRDRPGTSFRTPVIRAGVGGTEFVVEVAEDGATTLYVLDGEVMMTNEFGSLALQSYQAGLARPNEAPAYTSMIDAASAVQWVLFYPGILHLEDLPWDEEAPAVLQDSLETYRAGDLPEAMSLYPPERTPSSTAEQVYLAAILLGVGQVAEAQAWLRKATDTRGKDDTIGRLATSLLGIIHTVKGDPQLAEPDDLRLATEWLAQSYAHQARFELPEALQAAQRAVRIGPGFGFGWARVAELEFAFGRIDPARRALARALERSPRNAQAVALEGFLLAARNQLPEAIIQFNRAIELDASLGNAWLGRGLCRIKRGDVAAGREDLLVAAMSEPRRGVLRSYLGKAWQVTGEPGLARDELELAKEIDPQDPTAWLYSALLYQEGNRINPAIRDLEASQRLNDNRAVYRSRLMLDRDRAIRGANLANLFQDALMTEVSLREAARAVNVDYANYSSHLFLANTYNALRDPNQVNLRFETPWLSEYLVANLLAPVGAGTLSQTVSQNEYGRLFDRNRLGVVSSTEYLSRGDWTQSGSQFGVLNHFGYAVDAFYRSRNGQRVNDDLDLLSLSGQFKHQITTSDSVFLQAVYYDAEGGDLRQVYDPAEANTGLRFEESQEPILLAGYHREWGPGSHTLFLGGRVEDTLEVQNPQQNTLGVTRSGGVINAVVPLTLRQQYRNELELYTSELQQILQRGSHTWVVGGRYQTADYDTENRHASSFLGVPITDPTGEVHSDFQRANAYAYWHWQVADPLLLVGGLSYDWMEYPENFRFTPLTRGQETERQVSPKGGIILTPCESTTLRAGYSQSLGGVSFDQSFQLEPSQVAGFNQAWRSMIPESVAGANSAASFENWGVSLEQKLPTDTYLGASLEVLESELDRTLGIYEVASFFPPVIITGNTREHLQYQERALVLTADQLLGQEWTVGVRYRLSRAELEDDFREVPSSATLPAGFNFRPRSEVESVLHQVTIHALFAHPSGFLAQAEANWYQQSNQGYQPDRPGDDFWQANLFAGYRFPRRRAEVRLGILNVTDQDYRLHPLNLRSELVRERTFAASMRFYY